VTDTRGTSDEALASVHELPDGAPDGDGLTARQRLVLATIRASAAIDLSCGVGGLVILVVIRLGTDQEGLAALLADDPRL